MRIVKLPMSAWLTACGVALLVVALAMVGGTPGISQEEQTDECAVVFEPEEQEWSAQAYSYCRVYCIDLDCDGTPAPEDEEQCLALLDQYADATGGGIPPCEPQP